MVPCRHLSEMSVEVNEEWLEETCTIFKVSKYKVLLEGVGGVEGIKTLSPTEIREVFGSKVGNMVNARLRIAKIQPVP